LTPCNFARCWCRWRINDQKISEKVTAIQQAMFKASPSSIRTMCHPGTLHITILLLRLTTPEEEVLAGKVLQACEKELQLLINSCHAGTLGGAASSSSAGSGSGSADAKQARSIALPFSLPSTAAEPPSQPLTVAFRGLSTFGGRSAHGANVVFGDIPASSATRPVLQHMSFLLARRFSEAGLRVTNTDRDLAGFVPHLTVAKTGNASRAPPAQEMLTRIGFEAKIAAAAADEVDKLPLPKGIPLECFAEHKDAELGEQVCPCSVLPCWLVPDSTCAGAVRSGPVRHERAQQAGGWLLRNSGARQPASQGASACQQRRGRSHA
jgi:hypothetical protein